jgi:hypothetical protein
MSSIVVPKQTLDRLRDIAEPDAYIAAVKQQIGNGMPIMTQNWVLCACYIQHKVFKEITTVDGNVVKLERTDAQTAEDIWQGKASLVLACGSRAFMDDPARGYTWEDHERAHPGSWISFALHHSRPIEIMGIPCRRVQDYHIDSIFADPRHLTS